MSGRRRIILVSILVLGVLSVPALALAHPLGNFTINTSASLVLRADEVVVDYVVDMAEIPAFQAMALSHPTKRLDTERTPAKGCGRGCVWTSTGPPLGS